MLGAHCPSLPTIMQGGISDGRPRTIRAWASTSEARWIPEAEELPVGSTGLRRDAAVLQPVRRQDESYPRPDGSGGPFGGAEHRRGEPGVRDVQEDGAEADERSPRQPGEVEAGLPGLPAPAGAAPVGAGLPGVEALQSAPLLDAGRGTAVGPGRAWTTTRTNTDNNGAAAEPVRARPCSSVSYSALVPNAAPSLLNVCCYLRDRQVAGQAAAFEKEGGFTERLYRTRRARRRPE